MSQRTTSIAVLAVLAVLSACGTTEQSATPAQTATNGAISDAEILYGYRCKGCHEPATPGAPTREKLATWKPKKIQRALTDGKMKEFAVGLSQQELRDLSLFLSQAK